MKKTQTAPKQAAKKGRKVDHNSKRQRRLRKQRQKEKNPVLYFYNLQKQAAKQRGIKWSLTVEQFKILWKRREQLTKRYSKQYSFDRINRKVGYVYNNMRVISLSDNSRKGATLEHPNHPAKTAPPLEDFADDL